MRHNNTPATATQINNLIALVQTAKDERARAVAIGLIWEKYGDKIVGIAAKQSYNMDSDFGYHGYSVADRRAAVMGETFEVFLKSTQEFDATLGVPFMAHAAQKAKWQLQTDKRENAKRDDREVSIDRARECRSYKKKTSEKGDQHAADPENIAYIDRHHPMASNLFDDMEKNVYLKDAIDVMKRSLAKNPKLLRYFNTLMEICNEGLSPTDAEAASRLNCTRATTNNYRKQLLQHLCDSGLYEECHMALAA